LFTDKTLVFWVWPGMVTIFAIAALTLFALVNNRKLYAMGLGVLTILTYVVIFPKDPFVLLGGLIFLALMFLFEKRIRSEEKARQDFSIRRVSQACINVIVLGFL